jgi:hypothetical protein
MYHGFEMGGRPHTVRLECTEDCECLWNTKYEHYTNKTTGENAPEEILQEMNFPQLTIGGRKIEN